MRCIGTGGVALVTLALVAAPAFAAADENFVATGALTYSWQGEGWRGAMVVHVDSADRVERGELIVNGEPATVRVERTPGLSPTVCVDEVPGISLLSLHGRGGALTASTDAGLSAGRCAGPIASELARMRLPVKKSRNGRPTYDMRGTVRFIAGPFTGVIHSTLVLRRTHVAGISFSAGGSDLLITSVSTRTTPLLEHVELQYRVTFLPGVLAYRFSGMSAPFCETVAACGTAGTLSLVMSSPARRLTLDAFRKARRRVTARQTLRDLRRGRLSLFADTPGLRGQLAEHSVGGDGECDDTVSESLGLQVGTIRPPFQSPSGRRIQLAIVPSQSATDVLRTHCPGPAQDDLIGSAQNPRLAQGTISIGQLLQRSTTISVSRPGPFAGVGYVGSRDGAIRIHLSLVRVRVGAATDG